MIYTKKLLKQLKINNYNLAKLLILAGTILKANIKSPLKYNNAIVYRQIIGSMIYLLNYTHLNISYAVS